MDAISNIEKILTELFNREKELGTALDEEADTKHTYDMKYAREYLNAEGSVEARKAIALIACDEEYKAHLKKKAVKEFVSAKWKDALQATSARQSILSASVKGDFTYATSGQT